MADGLHDYLNNQHQGGNDRVENDMQANSIIRKIDQLNAKKGKNKELAKIETEKIKKWKDASNLLLDQQITYYRNLIHQYMDHLRKENPSLKTLNLPYGSAVFQQKTSGWQYDEDYLIEHFLATDRRFVSIKLNKQDMRDYFHETETTIYDPQTGKTLKGVSVTKKQEEFFRIYKKK